MYFCMYCVYMCVWNYVCILVRLVCYICMFVHMHTCMHVIFMRIYTHTDTAYTGFCSGRFCLGWFLSVPPSIGKQNVCMHTHNRRTCIHTLMHTFISSICVEAGERLLLCGDLNCADSQGRINDTLTDIFNACGLRQYVEVPTRGDNILDVLAADDRTTVNDTRVSDAGLVSDHKLILCKIPTSCNRQPVHHVTSKRLPH